MSAYVVDSATMDKVVRAICSKQKYDRRGRLFGAFDVDRSENWSKIGQALFAMNIEAVAQRYPSSSRNAPDNLPGGDVSEATTYRFKGMPHIGDMADRVACYKALQSLKYQCSEGNVTETELYLFLCAYIDVFAHDLILHMPEYDRAEW